MSGPSAERGRDPVRVFIGSGETSVLERKVLVRSLRETTARPLDICIFNGTHNALEWNDGKPVPAPMPLEIKYRNFTEFSLYRFLIPEICGHTGKAIYMDSDMLCFTDIGALFDMDMEGLDLRCVKSLYGEDTWATSVMLINCEEARFDLAGIMAEVDEGVFDYHEFMRFGPGFRSRHPLRIGTLDPRWNSFDRRDADTRILHFTDTFTQPWRYPKHPLGSLWYGRLKEAMDRGDISELELNRAVALGYAGTFLPRRLRPKRRWLPPVRRTLRRVRRWART